MSAERPGDRPTIRGFFEEDTPVYSSRRGKDEHSADYAKEYHPPAVPPASPDHQTIRLKRIELSRTIDPRRASTQKLVVRRRLKSELGAAPAARVSVRFWPVVLGVAALVVAVGLLWYRHTNTVTAPPAASAPPLLPLRSATAEREVDRLPPEPVVKSPEPSLLTSAPQASGAPAVATKPTTPSPQHAPAAHVPPAVAPGGRGVPKVVPSSTPTTSREPSAPREVWLQ